MKSIQQIVVTVYDEVTGQQVFTYYQPNGGAIEAFFTWLVTDGYFSDIETKKTYSTAGVVINRLKEASHG